MSEGLRFDIGKLRDPKHKLTGLIIVLRLLVQEGWIGQKEGFTRQ